MPYADNFPPHTLSVDNAKCIWRYESFPSFISLLQWRQLFFAKLSTPAERDPYEGKFSEVVVSDYAARYRPEFDQRRFADGIAAARAIERKNRNMRAVNCWRMSQTESAAMWKLYSGEHGLAIRTTLGGLKKSFVNEERGVYAYEVEYFDAVGPSSPTLPFHSGYAKRKSFEHERELRACVFVPEEDRSAGTLVTVELDSLIETVFIAPEGEPWLKEVVEGEGVQRFQTSTQIRLVWRGCLVGIVAVLSVRASRCGWCLG